MKIEELHIPKIRTAQLLLLCVPTCLLAAYMLWHLNQYFTVLNNQWMVQSLYISAGLFGGCLFYNYRFRFVSTFIPLILILSFASFAIGKIFTGELSAFYISAQFYIFSFLFIIGILTGWGFARFRYFPILLCAALLIIQMIVVSKTTEINAQKLIIAFIPVLFFAVYIIYTAELVRNMNPDEPSFGWFIGKKLLGFTTVSAIILLLILLFFNKDFKAIEKEFGGAGKQEKPGNSESLTKENKDGTVSNQKQMGMSGGRNSTKRLVFIARLDNYFPGTDRKSVV